MSTSPIRTRTCETDRQTRMQVLAPQSILASTSTSTPGAAGAATIRPPAPLQTISAHVRAVATTDGLRSLWRGVASVIMGAGPAHAAHFGMYEFVREISGGRGDGWWGVGGTGKLAFPAHLWGETEYSLGGSRRDNLL
jgi:solute carrier family 25 iron transporter 28/37